MFERIFNFIKRPTSKYVIINTLGNYLSVFFTAFFALILVRVLDPSQYGVLSVLLGIAYVLANILDFGTTATIYSYLPPLMESTKRKDLYRFIKSTFYYQSLFSLIVIGILFIFFPYLDKVFFKTDAPISELYLTAFSVMLFIWQNFVSNILFAAKKFLKANIYANISNAIKTVIILFLAATNSVSVGTVIFVFGIVGPVIFFLLLFVEKKDLIFVLMKSEVKKEEFRFRYTLTYFAASQFFNLATRMDLFLLSFFKLKNDVGFYGLAQKIILTILTTTVSITQVLSPAYSFIKTKREARSQFRTSFLYLLIPTILFLLLGLTPDFIFIMVFTEKYIQAATITRILSFTFIISALGNIPALFVLYTIRKPIYLLIANIAFFVIMTAGSLLLIPAYKMFGPPYAIIAAFAVNLTILSWVTVKEYKKLPN